MIVGTRLDPTVDGAVILWGISGVGLLSPVGEAEGLQACNSATITIRKTTPLDTLAVYHKTHSGYLIKPT